MSGSTELLKLRREKGLPLLEEQPALLAMPGNILTPVNTHNAKQAVRNVRQQKEDGADFIKIGLLSPDLFFVVVAEAKRIGTPVLGHVPGDVSSVAASDSGFKSVEHLALNYGGLNACSTEEDSLRKEAPKIPAILSYIPASDFTDRLSMKLLQDRIVNPAVGTSKEEWTRINRIIHTFSEKKAVQVAAIYKANHTWQCPTFIKLRTYELAFLPEVQRDFSYIDKASLQRFTKVTKTFIKELDPGKKQELLEAYNLQLRLVKIYDSVGVGILVGTDDYTGYSLHQEFEQLALAGLSPLHILQAATINGAEFLNRTAEMGTVEVGKIADLLLLDANPLDNVQNLSRIRALVHAGYYFSENDLNVLKQDAKPK